MPRLQTIRFAAGVPEAPFSGVWRLVPNRDDVYLGASKAFMKLMKLSLHQSGIWVLAATKQSGMTLRDGNRRGKRWVRPPSHVAGVVRGPSVVIHRTSLGSRPLLPDEVNRDVTWFPAPAQGYSVEFTMYFVDSAVPTVWKDDETVVAELQLESGTRVFLIASTRQAPEPFLNSVEELLRNNVFRYKDLTNHLGGSFLWFAESADELRTPLIMDLPVPVGLES